MGGRKAALVLQTNGWHWVLGETRAHQAHAVVGSLVCIMCDLSGLIENVEKASDTNGLQIISSTDRSLTKYLSFRCCNGFQLLWYHLATLLLVGNGCTSDMVDPDEWFDDLDLDSPC